VLVGEVELRLRQIVWDVCLERDWIVIALEITCDRVHLLVNVPPNVAAHEVVKAIKGRSSRYLRQEFPHLLKLPL
jgi:putative transposase